MPDDAVAYLLLVVDLLVVALVLTLPILAIGWLIGRVRRPPGKRQPEAPARGRHGRGSGRQKPKRGAAEPVLRRCDSCGVGWRGVPGDDVSKTRLKVRRWARRRSRAKKRSAPQWARRQGWSRCPSCLSTQVRTSTLHKTGS